MFRVGIVYINGDIQGNTFETKTEAENFILHNMERKEIKRADIKDLESGNREVVI